MPKFKISDFNLEPVDALARSIKETFIALGLVDKHGRTLVQQIEEKSWLRIADQIVFGILKYTGAKPRGAPRRRHTFKARVERYNLLREFKRREARNKSLTKQKILQNISEKWKQPQAGSLLGKPVSTLRRELAMAEKDIELSKLMARFIRRPLAFEISGIPIELIPRDLRSYEANNSFGLIGGILLRQ